jgi:response regulator RpfG family c-di-GMP phosphodiesterase
VAPKPRVLCVDDEPQVLEGVALSLRRSYEVLAAASGPAGLDLLAREEGIAVIVSDMRMPGMDGATFLGKARATAPDATRLLLTGHADVDSAAAAINEGRIFRFLTKPCAPATLLAAMEAAVEQHRLVTAERVLLQQTLRGSMQLMMDVLALAAPVAFGRAARLRRYASELVSKVPGAESWPVEVAAMLSEIGIVSLAPSTVDKLYDGKVLTSEEQQSVDRLPVVIEQLIAGIPRLDAVRAVLKFQLASFDGSGAPKTAPRGTDIPLGARVLHIVADFDRLERGDTSQSTALDTLRSRRGRYDPELLELFASILGKETKDVDVLELPIRAVSAGMVFLEDVRTQAGALLVARGHEATASLVERVRNFAPGSVREPVRVAARRAARPTEGKDRP